jgi:hypothetical protein
VAAGDIGRAARGPPGHAGLVRPAARRAAASLPAGPHRRRARARRPAGHRCANPCDVVPGVYAIGDATVIRLAHRLPLPKAGLFAEAEGNVVAERIAAELAGHPATAVFAGDGVCYVETGGGQALEINARFFADPPGADILGPSEDAMIGKVAFEADRLAAWFGR